MIIHLSWLLLLYAVELKNLLIMQTLVEWFNKEILRWRKGAAALWSIILAMMFGFIFMVIGSFDFIDPVVSIYNCLACIVTAEFWFLMLMLAFSIVLHIRLTVSHFKFPCDIPKTGIHLLWSHVQPRRLLFVAGHGLVFGIAAHSATKLISGVYGYMYRPCSQEALHSCLNETHLFIVLCACICGIVSAVTFFTAGRNVLRFPVVSQHKLFEVKERLGALLLMSARRNARLLLYFCIAYFLGFGSPVKTIVIRSMHLDQDEEAVALSSLRGLLSVSLLFYTWLTVTFVDFLFSIPHRLFTVYITEPFSFPIETVHELLQDKCLHNAISCNADPFVQYLGCLDLCRLSKFSPVRRQQIFHLTSLSGQPANWINLRTACLAQLNHLIDSLLSYGSTVASNRPGTNYVGAAPMSAVRDSSAVYGSAPPTSQSQGNRSYTGYNDVSLTGNLFQNVGTPGPAVDAAGISSPMSAGLVHRHVGAIQQGTNLAGTSLQGTSFAGDSPPAAQSLQPTIGVFNRLLQKVVAKLSQRQFVSCLIQEQPETVSRQLFVDARKYIFIVDGLSYIVCASYTEDKYGVVQASLSVVLSTLLDLLEAIERHLKTCPFTLRHPRPLNFAACEQFDVVLRFGLRTNVKLAIYRIVTTFHQHLGSIDLNAEHRQKLNSFEQFKE